MKHNSYILHMGDGSDYIMHHGVKGMHWGQHIFGEDDANGRTGDRWYKEIYKDNDFDKAWESRKMALKSLLIENI